MDIDSMVKSMMTAKRVPLDKLNQDKQLLEWKRESYREMNSKLYDFRTNKLTSKYGVSSAMNMQTAVTSGNTTAVQADASATANGIDMAVSVTQLATKAKVETAGGGKMVPASRTLAEMQMIIDGKDPSKLTEDEKKAYADKTYNFSINGVSFTDSNKKTLFTSDTSIATVVATINSKTDAKVTAKYDELTGKLIINSKSSGKNSEAKLGEDAKDSELLSLFNQKAADKSVFNTADGVNAFAYVNGVKIEKDTNTFSVNGVTLTLLKETTSTVGENVKPTDSGVLDNPLFITTTTDPTKAIETIKGFVEDYNALILTLSKRIGEAKYRDFAPLTDEQKAEMKDSDIEAWTEKAMSGLLKNDDILKSTLSSMRTLITEKLGSLSAMGITTGSYSENGKLYIDEAKLKQALTDNPQGAIDLLQGPQSAATTGLFDKLADTISKSLSSIADRAGTNRFSGELTSSFKEESVMGKQLKEYNKRISTMLDYLENAETRYYNQFSAMETAMNKLNSQSANLLSSFGMS
ncbi:hypothetical protein R70331_29125 [Paenibacillus sp. FSL R7-0331]|nr:hypothetical protein R70331_29125 [Paenibacillus sp. FSL R7-0331]